MQRNGSEILIECLLEQNVDTVFGYPGGAVLNIYDALYKYKDKITHYLTSHEQGASHAADGYARATGKVGVCIATSGPGATNLVTGIATAYMDSSPVVFITGNVSKNLLGKDSFQEVDIAGITMPITKHNFIVKDIEKLAETVRQAFFIAQEGRPGPVLIDITKDVTAAVTDYQPKKPHDIQRISNTITETAVSEAVELIYKSKKPVIYAGGGIVTSEAAESLMEFSKRIDAPVCVSLMGLGGYRADDDYFMGMLGMHGTKTSNTAVSECDLLIAIGARFSDRVISNASKFATKASILHIDIDPAEINKNILCMKHVVGDVKEVLVRLNQQLTQQNNPEWIDRIKELKKQYPLSYKNDELLRPQYILERIDVLTKGNAVITTDVGQHQMWAGQFIKYNEPKTFITSGGLGTMGFGLGAAIGAKVGMPNKQVFNITGDGCFRMNNIELATAVEYNIPVIDVIMNNHALGMVRQWQTFFYDKRYSQTSLNKTTSFTKIAEAYNALAINVTKKEEVDNAIIKALESGKPTVINCEIDSDEKVFPMVAPGSGINEIMMNE